MPYSGKVSLLSVIGGDDSASTVRHFYLPDCYSVLITISNTKTNAVIMCLLKI